MTFILLACGRVGIELQRRMSRDQRSEVCFSPVRSSYHPKEDIAVNFRRGSLAPMNPGATMASFEAGQLGLLEIW